MVFYVIVAQIYNMTMTTNSTVQVSLQKSLSGRLFEKHCSDCAPKFMNVYPSTSVVRAEVGMTRMDE